MAVGAYIQVVFEYLLPTHQINTVHRQRLLGLLSCGVAPIHLPILFEVVSPITRDLLLIVGRNDAVRRRLTALFSVGPWWQIHVRALDLNLRRSRFPGSKILLRMFR